jgi:soluble lytic murein transglycosylase-like protein
MLRTVFPSTTPSIRSLLAALMLGALGLLAPLRTALAADIYGFVDDKGVAHFAAEKIDARYQLFFKGGQSFDTAQGLAPLGSPGTRGARSASGAAGAAGAPPASRTLLALFEASPDHRSAKAALQLAARTHDIDYELLQALVATESGFDAQAVSPKGALGLMQLMPGTAERYGVRGDARATLEKKLFDPRVNIAAGSRYLRDLIAMFQGRVELALAAYNAGEGAVQRAGNRIPNYRETQNYVKTVLQLYAYLKPGSGGSIAGRGKAPGRVRMELAGASAEQSSDSASDTSPEAAPTAPATP